MSRDKANQSITDLARNNRFLMLQDLSHAESNLDFVIDPKTVKAMADGGVKHFVIEAYNEPYQAAMDDYLAGKLPREQAHGWLLERFKDKTDKFLDFLDETKKAGITVHALDVKPPMGDKVPYRSFAPSYTVGQVIEKYKNAANSEYKLIVKYLEKLNLPPDMPITETQDAWDEMLYKYRVESDETLAQKIADCTHGEKTAIFYGAGHGGIKNGQNGKDLDEHLENYGSVAKILLAREPFRLQFAGPYFDYKHNLVPHKTCSEIAGTVIFTDMTMAEGNTEPQIGFWQSSQTVQGAETRNTVDVISENRVNLPPEAQRNFDVVVEIMRENLERAKNTPPVEPVESRKQKFEGPGQLF